MKYIDLTMPVNVKTPVIPYDPQPSFTQIASSVKDGWNSHLVNLHTHFGTHIDAPWHMLPDGKKLGEFPLEKYFGTAVLLDVRGQKEIDADLANVKPGDILILRTDHTGTAGSQYYFDVFPVVSKRLALKAAEKKISMLGIDTFTLDIEPFEVHKYLLGKDILILENLINLDKIETQRFNIFIFPLRLDDFDGAPCRVIAQIQVDQE